MCSQSRRMWASGQEFGPGLSGSGAVNSRIATHSRLPRACDGQIFETIVTDCHRIKMSSLVKKCPSSLLSEHIEASGISSAGTVLGSSIMCDGHRQGHGHSCQVGKCNDPLTPTGVRVGSRTTCNQTRHVSAAEMRLNCCVERPLAALLLTRLPAWGLMLPTRGPGTQF